MLQYRYNPEFKPTRSAALAAIQRVDPVAYAKTRNFLDGTVTYLSPWITHGFTDVREAASLIHARHPLNFEDKLIFEFGWREFFKHVHGELGDAILKDIRRPVWAGRYGNTMPADIVEGRTGVEAIDKGVRLLYETGYLHNHVRMWIASYTVHLRKTSWRAGADWMYSHLLDGDLASNHLSWQWVAGTFSHKPYVFNAENVQRFARQWNCSGSVIDTSYEDLDAIARSRKDVGPDRGAPGHGLEVPPVMGATWIRSMQDRPVAERASDVNWARFNKAALELIHPWALGHATMAAKQGKPCVAIVDRAFHARHPWNGKRWAFVLTALQNTCEAIWIVDSENPIALDGWRTAFETNGIQARMLETLNPGYGDLAQALNIRGVRPETLLPSPSQFQPSFSRFYREATTLAGSLDAALNADEALMK